MRVGIYARVSTNDKDQDPQTQLMPVREFVAAQGWMMAGEFVDHAPATDLKGRTAPLSGQRRSGRRRSGSGWVLLSTMLGPCFAPLVGARLTDTRYESGIICLVWSGSACPMRGSTIAGTCARPISKSRV
jgi:hypothetical protein